MPSMKKNSSSFCNVTLRSGGEDIYQGQVTGQAITPTHYGRTAIKGWQTLSFQIDKVDPVHHLIVRIGAEVVAEVPPGSLGHRSESSRLLYDVVGETCFAIDLQAEDGERQNILDVPFLVEPRPEIASAYKVMLDDLANIHEGLAQDLFSRGFVSAQSGRSGVKHLNMSVYLDKVAELKQTLTAAVEQIGRQPAAELRQNQTQDYYRTGDRLDYQSLYALMRGAQSRDDVRRNAASQKIPVRRPRLTIDIPEHRHLARGIKSLAEFCKTIEEHCSGMIPILQAEEERWGEAVANVAALSRAGHPKIDQLENYIQDASALREDFNHLIQGYDFLRKAQQPRTPFGPTPLFTGHTAYARAYKALRETAELGKGFVEGESLRIHLKSMTTLFEYWCFYKTVEQLKQYFGAPRGNHGYGLDSKIYKPDLTEGQVFTFKVPGGVLEVAYEPDIPTWKEARMSKARLGATMTARPLAPDVLISLIREHKPLRCMVLDAKSTSNFEVKNLRDMSDYARQVFEVTTGEQPIKAVFAMHRTPSQRAVANVPGYFERAETQGDPVVVGAIPAIPESVGVIPISLNDVLLKFLADAGVFAGQGNAEEASGNPR